MFRYHLYARLSYGIYIYVLLHCALDNKFLVVQGLLINRKNGETYIMTSRNAIFLPLILLDSVGHNRLRCQSTLATQSGLLRNPFLRAEERLSLLFKVTLLHEKVHFHLSVTYNFFCIG